MSPTIDHTKEVKKMSYTKFKIMQARDRAYLFASKEIVLNGDVYALDQVAYSAERNDINGWYTDADEILTIPCDNLTVQSSRRIAIYLKQN